ncbi:MAG: hypothetical protein WCS88_04815 [Patescibacteria group bacterium]|jgi:hypothetical protein
MDKNENVKITRSDWFAAFVIVFSIFFAIVIPIGINKVKKSGDIMDFYIGVGVVVFFLVSISIYFLVLFKFPKLFLFFYQRKLKIDNIKHKLESIEKTWLGKLKLIIYSAFPLFILGWLYIIYLQNIKGVPSILAGIILILCGLIIFAIMMLILREISLLLFDLFSYFFDARFNQLLKLRFRFTVIYILNILSLFLFGNDQIKNFIVNGRWWWIFGIMSLIIINIGEYYFKDKEDVFEVWSQGNNFKKVLSVLIPLILVMGVLVAIFLISIIDIWEIGLGVKNVINYL